MALHTLAAVVDDELSRGSPSISPSNMQQQRTNNANASSIAMLIPGEHSAEDEKIDLKGTLSKGPVRKRVPRSEEKGTSVSKITKKKKKKKPSDGGGIAKKSKANDNDNDEGGGEGGGEPNAVSSVSTAASYRDYSTLTEEEMCDPASLIYSSASAKESPFPAKLHRILSNPDFQDVISFLPHGRSWRVLKPKAFEERVIPLFFRHCRYSSFMRQVNGWGFQRVHQGPDVNSYYHEMFLRGMPHLSLKMRRPSAKEMKARAVELVRQDVPDFYKISEKSPLPEYDFVKSGKKSKKKGKNNAADETDEGNDDASNAETETPAQPQDQQQQQGPAAQLQAGVALPQLLGLVALQEKQKQLLAAAAGQQQPQAQLQVPNAPVGLQTNAALAALLGGAGSVSPQLNLNPAQVLSPAAQQPMVVQSAAPGVQPAALGNVTLLQLLVAQQEQQQRQQAAQAQAQAQQAAQAQAQQQQQQQQQLALLQSSGLLGATQAAAAATANAANAANAGSNADAELNRLRAALASSQMQNQVMAAALLSKQPPPQN